MPIVGVGSKWLAKVHDILCRFAFDTNLCFPTKMQTEFTRNRNYRLPSRVSLAYGETKRNGMVFIEWQ